MTSPFTLWASVSYQQVPEVSAWSLWELSGPACRPLPASAVGKAGHQASSPRPQCHHCQPPPQAWGQRIPHPALPSLPQPELSPVCEGGKE